MCSKQYQHQRKATQAAQKYSPLETNEPVLAVPVTVTISLAEAPLVTVVATKVERLEDAGEQREVGLARMSLEEGAGVDVGGVRNSARYGRRDDRQNGQGMHGALHGREGTIRGGQGLLLGLWRATIGQKNLDRCVLSLRLTIREASVQSEGPGAKYQMKDHRCLDCCCKAGHSCFGIAVVLSNNSMVSIALVCAGAGSRKVKSHHCKNTRIIFFRWSEKLDDVE